jgi:DNA-binding response OmpR family regulator
MSAPSVNSTHNETTATAGERRSPLAFIIDEEASIRQFVSLILQGGGVDTIEFVDGPSFRDTQIMRAPDLVFLNVNLEAQDAVQSIKTLSRSEFAGAVQLISNRGSAGTNTPIHGVHIARNAVV